MAKMSAINKNNKRIKLSNKFFKKRKALKKIIMNKNLSESLILLLFLFIALILAMLVISFFNKWKIQFT